MRVIPTAVHGILDYAVAAILVVLPIIARYPSDAPEALVPMILGAGTVLYSLATDYELGAGGFIPMPVHLALDAASGVVLLASPWLFGFADRTWAPHVGFGVLELAVVALSQARPGTVAAAR
ncbi:MAG TPA: hypothetical protein VM597_37490 [Gemmataceae bacterium]|nr:hypothetical protein [Gemmataceae bacterium]